MRALSPYYNSDKIINLDDASIDQHLAEGGVNLEIGPFCVNIKLAFKNVRDEFIKIYGDYPFYDHGIVWDNYINISGRNFYRQYIRPQAWIDAGMSDDFVPLPAKIGMVSLEMGLNWHVASDCKQYLMFHAGVVAKDGVGLIMPAASGSGKSTLAAGLSYRGWQLHSDEFGLYDMQNRELVPYPRAVSLKNESIDVMRNWVSEVDGHYNDYFTEEFHGTPKGTICYMRPHKTSIETMHVKTKPNLIILPIFDPEATAEIRPITKAMAFFRLVLSSANYGDIGKDAFLAISKIIEESDVCEIIYPNLEDAVKLVEQFVEQTAENRGQQ